MTQPSLGHGHTIALHGPEFAADPAGIYARLRRHGPAAPVELAPGVRAMLVTSYQAALWVLRSPRLFAKDPRRWRALAEGEVPSDSPLVPMMGYRPNCLFADGAAHVRLRQAVTDSLDRIDPHSLRALVSRNADRLIERFETKGEVELISGYASALPLLVFNELFGLPDSHGDHLVLTMARLIEGGGRAKDSDAELGRYMVRLITAKRHRPGSDVTSWLMSHPAGLTDDEMIHQCTLLLSAGIAPLQNLIANGVRLLLSDDRFAAGLIGGRLPIDAALDEILWLDPPMANFGVHFPVQDVDLAGILLRQGEPVVISYAAANTDPSVAKPGGTSGNRAHLAFSAGPHACPAKDPSRLIASVAIERLLDRVPDLEMAIDPDQLQWRLGPFQRALLTLPVSFTPVDVTRPSDMSGPWTAWPAHPWEQNWPL